MNEFSELEAELKQLRPAAPSADLIQRVECALVQAHGETPTAGIVRRPREFQINWMGLGLGLAAAAAFLMLARVSIDKPVSTSPRVAKSEPVAAVTEEAAPRILVPDGLTRVVYNRSDEGLVFPRNSAEPVRQVRSRSRETLQWKDPSTGASLRVSYPTEEVELVPVSYQ